MFENFDEYNRDYLDKENDEAKSIALLFERLRISSLLDKDMYNV